MIGAVDSKVGRGWVVVVDGVRCRVLGMVGGDRWRLVRPDRSTFLLAAGSPETATIEASLGRLGRFPPRRASARTMRLESARAAADTVGREPREVERRAGSATALAPAGEAPTAEPAPSTDASDGKT